MNDLGIRLIQLKQKTFIAYLISIFLGTLGGGLSYITLTWAVTRNHGGLLNVAILMLCFWLPSVILGPLSGVIVDKYNITNKVMAAALFIRAVLYVGFFILCYEKILALHDSYIYTMAVISGACLCFYGTAAMRYVREIIPHKDLVYANTTIDIAYEIGNVVGMSVSGLLIAAFSIHGTFGIIGVIFVIASISLMRLKRGPIKNKKENSAGFFGDFKDAMSYLMKNKPLFQIASIQFILLIGIMITPVLLAPFAREVLHASVGQFGDIEAALSIGIILGGFITPTLARTFGFKEVILVQLIILCVGFSAFSINKNISIATLIYFINGFGFACWPLLVTEVQNNTALNFQGRIQGVLNSLTALGVLTMYAFIELISKMLSLSEIFYVVVAALIICVIILLKYKRPTSSFGSKS